jgi:hypothetical protein
MRNLALSLWSFCHWRIFCDIIDVGCLQERRISTLLGFGSLFGIVTEILLFLSKFHQTWTWNFLKSTAYDDGSGYGFSVLWS